MIKLVYYPNPILLSPCEDILVFNDDLDFLLDSMKTILINSSIGIGIAANQCNISKRAIIIKVNDQFVEMINPVIIDKDGKDEMIEGCLSAPTIGLSIVRSKSVMVQYQTRTGEIKQIMAQGVEARCIQHEIDHLDGIFYFSKVNRDIRKIAISKLKKVLK